MSTEETPKYLYDDLQGTGGRIDESSLEINAPEREWQTLDEGYYWMRRRDPDTGEWDAWVVVELRYSKYFGYLCEFRTGTDTNFRVRENAEYVKIEPPDHQGLKAPPSAPAPLPPPAAPPPP